MLPLHDLARTGHPLALAACFLVTACGGCGGGGQATGAAGSGGSSSASSTSSSASAGGGDAGTAVNRGPTVLPVAGDPNGLFWDDATATLYIADSNNNRVLTWHDGGSFTKLADLPTAPQNGPGLGQLVKTADGKIVVVRFGFGTAGDVVYVNPDLTTAKVPSLDPTKRRIGLTVAPDGSLYDGYFIQNGGTDMGAVAKLSLTGTEVDVITGLDKPVGVLALGTLLYVSDQLAGTILQAPLATPSKDAILTMIDGPDLLCPGPGTTFFTGGTTGEIRQVTATGTVTTFASGFKSVRGVAYDAKNKRVFGSDHDPNGTNNAVRILPVNG